MLNTIISHPCVCCKVVPHEGYADRQLGGYVCRECWEWLRWAEWVLAHFGMRGCTRWRDFQDKP